MMNVYTCNEFRGHYPVGVAAVVVAADHEHAATLLEQLLIDDGLRQTVHRSKLRWLCEAQEGTPPNALMLTNGDY